MSKIQRFNPHHAITAPLGMMRYEDEGRYVLYADHAAQVAVLTAEVEQLRRSATSLVDAMETCRICKGTVLVEESAVHCEDCSDDCDYHEGPECVWIYDLHRDLKAALAPQTGEKP